MNEQFTSLRFDVVMIHGGKTIVITPRQTLAVAEEQRDEHARRALARGITLPVMRFAYRPSEAVTVQ